MMTPKATDAVMQYWHECNVCHRMVSAACAAVRMGTGSGNDVSSWVAMKLLKGLWVQPLSAETKDLDDKRPTS